MPFQVALEPQRQITAIGLLVLAFVLYPFLLAVEQDWRDKNNRPRRQFFWLVILSNVVGTALFVAFVLLVKGG